MAGRDKRRRSIEGKVVEVFTVHAGDELVGDHAIGSTYLQVDDTADYEEGVGQVQVDGVVLTQTHIDDDLNRVYLSAPTTVAYTAGEEVLVYPLASEKRANVHIEEEREPEDCAIRRGLAVGMVVGIRDEDEQETAILEFHDGEYVVVDTIAPTDDVTQDIGSGTPIFWKEEDIVISPAHVTLGSITMRLSHIPEPESFLAWWHPEGEA